MLRRHILQASILTASTLLFAGCMGQPNSGAAELAVNGNDLDPQPDAPATDESWKMPDEGDPHKQTWMAFATSEEIWGDDLLPAVQQNLATIAQTIARFEPVSMLVPPTQLALAKELIGAAAVQLIPAEVDDLWMRDTGPVFAKRGSARAATGFNFNGWGNKQTHIADAKVAALISQRANVEKLSTKLVLEGGGIEVDGQGTAIITESCVLNDNRNPGWTKGQVEQELRRLLGIEKVIWLPGIAGKDITDGHTDFYARFAAPGVVVAGYDPDPASYDHDVTTRHLDILRQATDARGNRVRVEVLEGPTEVREEFADDDFAAGYINFYICNKAIIAPEFGDQLADEAARATLARLFPDREVVQLNIDAIAAGGGGIHCTTQQEPAL